MTNYNRNKPYNSLPPLPPKADLYTRKVLVKTITASRALGKLSGALSNLPNPNLFIDTIQLKEAKASSEIENIITTNDELFDQLEFSKLMQFNIVHHSNVDYKYSISGFIQIRMTAVLW